MDTDSKPTTQDAVDSIVLEEEIDPNYVPSEPEVVEYAKWMGMDLDKDQDLFWIAREGLMAPLPKDWKPCKTKDTEDIYYFNFTTGDSTWDHPCDGYYKRLYEEEKKKKETVIKESGDQNRSKAKQDVEQLLGKAEKKKNKKVPRALGEVDMVKALPAPLGLQKAPLPGISNPLRMSAPSSLGPLGGSNSSSGGGLGSGDPLGSLSKGGGLLRKSDMDMKVSSSLEGPRLGSLVSSRDPSPLNSSKFTAAADQKTKLLSAKQIVEQKGSEDEGDVLVRGRETESDVERRMGRLDVTAGLSSGKSRSLGAASKLRSALPSANSPVDRGFGDHQNSPSEEKQSDSSRYNDYKASDEKSEESAPSNIAWRETRETVPDSSSLASSINPGQGTGPSEVVGPGERDVAYYKDKCAAMERRVEEYELRVADYKTSYSSAKDDLLALERRYEASQSQWMDRLRAVEVEKDKVEGERRQLKLALIDLEAAASAATTKPSLSANSMVSSQSIDEATRRENDRLSREVEVLKNQVHTAEATLARSASTHLELQQRLLAAENDAQSRIALLEAQHSAALVERTELLRRLEENKFIEDEGVRPQSADSDVAQALYEEKSRSAKKDTELAHLRALLAEEQSRAASALDALHKEKATAAATTTTAEATRRAQHDADGKMAELQQQVNDLQAKVASQSAQLLKESADNTLLKARAQTAEASVTVLEATLAELRAVETALKRDVADKDRKLSDQQEQALALAASTNLSTNVDNERSAQFEVFVSQATAIRKSLKAEIERQKSQLSELESEKSALVTQLTRQETTLQFAKKELNAVADLKETNRQLDSEKQQLALQLEAARTTLARQAEQEFQFSEQREKDLQARVQNEAMCSALRQENDRLVLTLEQERTAAVQSEKKIKSYQEELLQLQRRLAEKTSPQKVSRSNTEMPVSAFSPASSPLPFGVDTAAVADSPALSDSQQQLSAKQAALDQAVQDLTTSASRLVESERKLHLQQHITETLNEQIADLQDQLRTATLQLSEVRVKHADQSGSLTISFQKEKEQFDLEKLNLTGQVRNLQSQLSSVQENFEYISASAKRLEAEVSTYREKWLSSEKELTDARLQLSSNTVGADLTTSALRIELREALFAVQHGKAAEEALRAQMMDLRKSLEDRDSTIRDLRADALRAAYDKDKENMQQQQQQQQQQQSSAAVPVSISESAREQVFRESKDHHQQQHQSGNNNYNSRSSSSSTQHIVALSLEVGRQQATMERLEQHIRNTEIVLQEIKTQGGSRTAMDAKKSSNSNSTPASPTRTASRRSYQQDDRRREQGEGANEEVEERVNGWESSTPESQQSLLVGRGVARGAAPIGMSGEFSSSPARRARNRQKAAKLVQFQFPSKSKDRRGAGAAAAGAGAAAVSPFVDLVELVDLKDRIATLVENLDMDVHDCTTLGTSSGRDQHEERFVRSTAQRVLIEGKARLKQETKFLKEVQAICLSAKDSITHNQECVKNMKAVWRSAKNESGGVGERGDASGAGLSTESVNSVTLKVNSAVDELRETQQMTKARENRMKSLLQSVQYLEQLVDRNDGADSDNSSQQQHLEHLMEIMRLVQEKCMDSAADLEALVLSYRSKGSQRDRVTAPSKQQQQYGPSSHAVSANSNRARGVAFTSREQQLSFPAAETFLDPSYSAPAGHATADAHYHYRQQPFASLPLPSFSSATTTATAPGSMAPSVTVSAAVSSMRNSELKNRLLQEQIAKITERQSLSKEAYDKHAGWLSTLGREISGVVHGNSSSSGGGNNNNDNNSSSRPSAFKTSTSKSSSVGDELLLLSSSSSHRTFGTPLHNHNHNHSQPVTATSSGTGDSIIDALLHKL